MPFVAAGTAGCKRRRSILDEGFIVERAEEGDVSTRVEKRRYITPDNTSLHLQEHHYASLGSKVLPDDISEEVSMEQESSRYGRDGSEEGSVDETMHGLRLVSKSPPDLFEKKHELPTDATVEDHRGLPPFLPRQIRSAQQSVANVQHKSSILNAPHRPSPLARSQQFEEGSSSSSPRSGMSTMSDFVSEHHQEFLQSSTPPPDSNRLEGRPLRRSHSGPHQYSSSHTIQRTPSPSPRLSEDGEANQTWSRPAQFSPGLSPSPQFPGAKQMLRYTMGFRDDCQLCRDKGE